MRPRIIVQEQRPGGAPAEPKARIDFQDWLLVGFLVFTLTGVAFLNWKVALILAGLLCGFFHYLIGAQKARAAKKHGPTHP
jgi:hypothetical protein